MLHRIAVRLSFAHAQGRNYRQLPAKARLREKPLPADIFCSKRYSLSPLQVRGGMLFSAQEYRPKGYLGLIMHVGGGIEMAAGAVCEGAKLPFCR